MSSYTQTELKMPNKAEGYRCPCCGQFVKEYARKLNSSMARVLILIYQSGITDYMHVEDYLKKLNRGDLRADFHKLRYWGLLKKKVENREDSSPRNGFYKISPQGIMFVEGKVTVPEKIIVYNNELKGHEGSQINIIQALGNKFSYQELMNNN